MQPPTPPPFQPLRPWLLLALATYVAVVACWGVSLQYPRDGLDPSWEQLLVAATDQRRTFGSELVFTYGPLHQVVTGQAAHSWTAFWVGRTLFSVSWFLVALLAGRQFGLRVALAIALSLSLVPVQDTTFYLLAFLGIVLGFRLHAHGPAPGPAGWLLTITLACACAVAPLAKLSFLGSTVPALLVLLGLPLLKVLLRRAPWSLPLGGLLLTPALFVSLVWGITVNWSPRSLVTFFVGANLDIVNGFSSAMSFAPSNLDWTLVGVYGLLTASAAGFYWQLQARDAPRDRVLTITFPVTATVSLFALAIVYWVVFKSSFVRGDAPHLTTGAYWILGTLLILLALPAPRLTDFLRSHSRLHCAGVLLLPFALSALLLFNAEQRPSLHWIKQRLGGAVDHLRLFAATGRQKVEAARTQALVRIREQTEDFGLPAGASADILPWDVSQLLARDLNYTPRPVPQSYKVYTANLQRLNRDFVLHSSTRPEYYIVSLGDIDGRLPIGLDSAVLLNLRRAYEFDHRGSKGTLIFKRKPEPAQPVIRVETLATGSLTWAVREGVTRWSSSPIALPPTQASALVLQATFRDGLARSALGKLYRPFPVQLEYLDQSGNVLEKARFISDAAEELLVHPIVRTNEELLRVLYPNQGDAGRSGNAAPSAIRFSVKDFLPPFSRSEFRLMAYHFQLP